MTMKFGLSTNKMAARIYNREDNQYKRDMIKEILDMYADEIYKAVLKGERVQITRVGTIIPEVRTHKGHYNMPTCNRFAGENPPPYTRVKMTRNWSIKEAMDKQLLKNIENGILGLEKLPFDTQQINILKDSGYIAGEGEDVKEDE